MCRKGFSSFSALEAHVQSSHWKCPSCSKVFSTKEGMQGHQKDKHPPIPPAVVKFVCEVACGRSFSSKALRDEHVLTTHPACEHCSQRFLSNTILQNHVASAHSQCNCAICLRNSNPKLYCDICSDQFASQGQLQTHYLESPNHTQCTTCNVGFPNVDSAKEVGDLLCPLPINYRC